MHRCANVVTGAEGGGEAVLLRAITPLAGIDAMRTRRGRSDLALSDGPGKLCQALGIDLQHDGVDLLAGTAISIDDDGMAPPAEPFVGPRIGISKAVDAPLRFRVALS
jgi:DNA-3-methyladenine glycosylase